MDLVNRRNEICGVYEACNFVRYGLLKIQTKFKPRDSAELYLQPVGNMIIITYVLEHKYVGG